MYKYLLFVFIIQFNFCHGQAPENKSHKIFNEGVSLSLEAAQAMAKDEFEQSQALNRLAIKKFQETLEIDPNHLLAPSALGHSYYLIRDFQKGIEWYAKAIQLDSNIAINHLEYGLCKINKGNIEEGRKAIDKALSLDTSSVLKEQTVFELMNIGILAFDYGEGYEAQGEAEKGVSYKRFAIGVMIMTYEIAPENRTIIAYIVDYAEKFGDTDTADFFPKKTKRINLFD